jgi:hypothetical protein
MLRDTWLVIQAHPVFHSPVVLPDELRSGRLPLVVAVSSARNRPREHGLSHLFASGSWRDLKL